MDTLLYYELKIISYILESVVTTLDEILKEMRLDQKPQGLQAKIIIGVISNRPLPIPPPVVKKSKLYPVIKTGPISTRPLLPGPVKRPKITAVIKTGPISTRSIHKA